MRTQLASYAARAVSLPPVLQRNHRIAGHTAGQLPPTAPDRIIPLALRLGYKRAISDNPCGDPYKAGQKVNETLSIGP